jgi:hypothetical protein
MALGLNKLKQLQLKAYSLAILLVRIIDFAAFVG